MSSVQTLEPDEIVHRMNSIRNVSEVHVADLHDEAQRLGDWREYVKARPLVSVLAASVLGYSVVSSIAGRGSCGHVGRPGRNGSHEAASQEQHREEVATSAGLTSGVMAFVGSLASAALRQYALQKLRSFEK